MCSNTKIQLRKDNKKQKFGSLRSINRKIRNPNKEGSPLKFTARIYRNNRFKCARCLKLKCKQKEGVCINCMSVLKEVSSPLFDYFKLGGLGADRQVGRDKGVITVNS